MNIIRIQPEPETRPSSLGKWALGIAMFAAFVIPFLLLIASARYRVFVAQAKHTFGISQIPSKEVRNTSSAATLTPRLVEEAGN
ncbi:hypothetical protein ETAA8_38880 [Anatilimnocola aggregata]|uniref:Uncharacterized protein n=1 Tax=Anatilimnocola aggregata TaxID=2528021 RepID=A0A517YEX5_9BACT|nr:hypothetical protein [Anatilimnocola aggregata]QDU28783.1 hypothetical protein ETAA8_38880 [Anatilimnocola aggregata]